MDGEAAAPGMVGAAGVDQQEVGCPLQSIDRRGQHRPFPQCQQPGHVRSAHGLLHHRLFDDIRRLAGLGPRGAFQRSAFRPGRHPAATPTQQRIVPRLPYERRGEGPIPWPARPGFAAGESNEAATDQRRGGQPERIGFQHIRRPAGQLLLQRNEPVRLSRPGFLGSDGHPGRRRQASVSGRPTALKS